VREAWEGTVREEEPSLASPETGLEGNTGQAAGHVGRRLVSLGTAPASPLSIAIHAARVGADSGA